MPESRVAPAAATPGSELAGSARGSERRADRGPAFRVCVEQQPGPGGRRRRARRRDAPRRRRLPPMRRGPRPVRRAPPPSPDRGRRARARRACGRRSSARPRSRARAGCRRPLRTRSGAPRPGRTPADTAPGGRGAVTAIVSSRVSPGATSRGSGVRGPSQTMGLPSGSSQWYEACTPSSPRERQVAVPAFSSSMWAMEVAPARGGGSSDHASQRGASGPAATKCSPTRCTLRATLGACEPSRFSCAPRGARKSSGRRCGSCARRAGRFRNIAPSARSTRSSMSPTRPSCAQR